ncbi:MAG: hypothetical protein ABI981_08320 [Betaproteobacteria bacterium]
MPSASAIRLADQLATARALHAQRAASARLATALDQIAHFQSLRLSATYADLEAQSRYSAAIAFFRSDLYGPGDFSRRDADLARIVPTLARMLPERALATVADAMQLSVLSQQLDRLLLAHLAPDAELDVARYCAAYRACANPGERVRQIALIGAVGGGFEGYVRSPLLRNALFMMRVPARAAGLGALQAFLERGVAGFARMRGAAEFLGTIEARESALMHAIFAGDDDAFADPRAPRRATLG